MDHGKLLSSCQCVTCDAHLDTNCSFRSTVTGATFSLPDNHYEINPDTPCKTKNVVYLITCKKCSIQYVGQTGTLLRTRMGAYRTKIRHKQSGSLVHDHFNLDDHSLSDLKVQILYHVKDGQFKNKSDIQEDLLNMEYYYQSVLCTFYPFGLNDKVETDNIYLKSYDFSLLHCLNTPFFIMPVPEFRKSTKIRGKNRKHSNKVKHSTEEFIRKVDSLISQFRVHQIYLFMRGLSKRFLSDCVNIVTDCSKTFLNDTKNVFLAYMSKFKPVPHKEKTNDAFIKVPFLNKVIEDINFGKIINDDNVRAYLPCKARKFKIRTSLSYGKTIGAALFNYNSALKDLQPCDLKDLDNCDCNENYKEFVYSPHGHVHTGNINIVENSELRSIMKFGAKYREQCYIKPQTIVTTINDSLDAFIKSFSARIKTIPSNFKSWKEIIMEKVRYHLRTTKESRQFTRKVLSQTIVKDYIQQFQKRFVLVPVDKAGNNFAVICRRFYISVLCGELGIHTGNIQGNNVYRYMEGYTTQTVVEKHKKSMKNFGIKIDSDLEKVPLLYWTSKQHKNPYKFRFIAGAYQVSTSPISEDLSLILKCIKTLFKRYSYKIYNRSGISRFWSVDNSKEFLDKINHLGATSIHTFDFSTLYTNLPLDSIYESLESLIIKMFKLSNSNAIFVNKKLGKAYWKDKNPSGNEKEYILSDVLEALKFVLHNSYVQFAGYIFLQILGIPMGGNASPDIADLYLAWCEFVYIEKLVKKDSQLARKFNYNSRYIDDIATPNFKGFGDIAKEIYHKDLILEPSTGSGMSDTFLDLHIRVSSNRFVIGIYHKVDDFAFDVINFPFPSSNIRYSEGPKTFYSQLIRFHRLCNNPKDFLLRLNMTYTKLLERGYTHDSLYRMFLKFNHSKKAHLTYGFASVQKLWEGSKTYCRYVSVNVKSSNSIKKIINPCSVSLLDIHAPICCNYVNLAHPGDENIIGNCTGSTCPVHIPSPKPKSSSCTYPNNSNTSFNESITSNSKIIPSNTTIGEFTVWKLCLDKSAGRYAVDKYRPFGLKNFTGTCCYMNSLIQVLLCISAHDKSNPPDIHILNSKEGKLVKDILSFPLRIKEFTLRSNNTRFYNKPFINKFAIFSSILDGTKEQDVHECFGIIKGILEKGSRTCLLENSADATDDMFTSLPQFWFQHGQKITYVCTNCKLSKDDYELVSEHHLIPVKDANVLDLLVASLKSKENRGNCTNCKNSSYNLSVNFTDHPRILCLLIMRYTYENGITKMNSVPVKISTEISFDNTNYQLISVIHHHRNQNTRHYTSTVKYLKYYHCNDSVVEYQKLGDLEKSQTAYLVMYKQTSKLSITH